MPMNKKIFEKKWAAASVRLEKVTDAVGYPVEEGIKPTILALWLLGFTTWNSCEGHFETSLTPFVDIHAPNKPAYRWDGEEVFEYKTLKAIGATKADILPGIKHKTEISDKYQDLLYLWQEKQGWKHSKTYLVWLLKSHALTMKLARLVTVFNYKFPHKSCLVSVSGGKLEIWDKWINLDKVTVQNGKLNASEKRSIIMRLNIRKKVMRQFTDFLVQEVKKK